ncbi:MAG TPA: hypothetical protein PKE04_09120, partial [Clostridia bacterium]|nr:hypothetical protein [Clostridia bacterium]
PSGAKKSLGALDAFIFSIRISQPLSPPSFREAALSQEKMQPTVAGFVKQRWLPVPKNGL